MHKCPIIVCALFLLICTPVLAQQSKNISYSLVEHEQKKLFKSTLWMPERGVRLLNKETSKEVWERYNQEPHKTDKINALSVFETKHLHLVVFNVPYYGINWHVYSRKDGSLEFASEGISGGYDHRGPKHGGMGGCTAGSTTTSVNFRQYTKEGPLFLEVYVPGCREGNAHHEFLFHLDEETLREVEGSRFVMNDYYNTTELSRGWRWWPKNNEYVRLGYVNWSDKGEMQWTRKFNTHLRSLISRGGSSDEYNYPQPEVHRHCRYDKTARRVRCEAEIVRKVTLKASYFLDFGRSHREYYDSPQVDHLKEVLRHTAHMTDAGYILPEKELAKLGRALSKMSKGK